MTEPRTADPAPESTVVSLSDLLSLTGCADIEELSSEVYEDSDIDTWVSASADGVEIRTAACAIGLPYPFALHDFWDVVAEVEADYLRRCADWGAASLDAGASRGGRRAVRGDIGTEVAPVVSGR